MLEAVRARVAGRSVLCAVSGGVDSVVLLHLLLRVSGVTVAAELAAQLCRDAGAGALAQKLELVGKAVILCACLPVLVQLCDVALSLLA